ncbi:MAG: Rpn family recombination-promoting nuclease/putative transposase, partial [Leptolyngbyaceae cyanobacterium CAN_BIN12]|nr:Rpn family recombination-promoting nuclease/putative transposase [Leptolyngbyaceae cyanobacterium CAN_BIN12]
MSMPRSDQDSPWKDILRQYFQDAITFFFPLTAARIEWNRPHEFLDKEFQQIAPEAEIGRRYADQLVKLWLKQGQELWLLIHIEIQAKPEATFAERMLEYHLRIFDRFHSHATSLAILCDGNAKWRPNHYHFGNPDTELTFRFGMVKLLDYRDQWESLEQNRNPFAVVVMAHLKAQETQRDSKRRKESKLGLIRRLYEQGYERREIINLFRFIDWVMILPKGLEREFWQELKVYEEERRMPYITSVEQIGF